MSQRTRIGGELLESAHTFAFAVIASFAVAVMVLENSEKEEATMRRDGATVTAEVQNRTAVEIARYVLDCGDAEMAEAIRRGDWKDDNAGGCSATWPEGAGGVVLGVTTADSIAVTAAGIWDVSFSLSFDGTCSRSTTREPRLSTEAAHEPIEPTWSAEAFTAEVIASQGRKLRGDERRARDVAWARLQGWLRAERRAEARESLYGGQEEPAGPFTAGAER